MTPKFITDRLILREIKGNDLFGYYEILSNKETMRLFGGPILANDLDNKDFVQRMKKEREEGICYFWSITLKEEKEFIGFVRLMSYNSKYYNASFSSMGEYMFDNEFLKYFDRTNGWEIDYALLEKHRNKGIMQEAVGSVLNYCGLENISPVYAKVNSLTNIATVKVLEHHGFKDHLPQIDKKLLEQYEAKELIDKNQFGMVFKWTSNVQSG
jgi:RimJ/RimL family protein N-acetyltransferase